MVGEKLLRSTVLNDSAFVHDGDLVAKRESFHAIMGDEEHGNAEGAEQVTQLTAQRLPCWAVQAESGSSSKSNRGCGASVRARATRCFWPPES